MLRSPFVNLPRLGFRRDMTPEEAAEVSAYNDGVRARELEMNLAVVRAMGRRTRNLNWLTAFLVLGTIASFAPIAVVIVDAIRRAHGG